MSIGLYGDAPAPDLVELARLIERLGFHGLWVPDSHVLWRECYALLGGVAAATSRLRLAVITNSVTRHESVVSSAAATLAELSNDRFVVTLGEGDTALHTTGIEPDPFETFVTKVQSIRGSLAPHARTTCRAAPSRPLPPASPVPTYVLGHDDVRARVAAEHADGIVSMCGPAPAMVSAVVEMVRDGASLIGRDPQDLEVIVWTACAISDSTPALARSYVKHNIARVILRTLPAQPSELAANVAENIRNEYDFERHGDPTAPVAELIPDELVGEFALAGTAADVSSGLEALRDLQVDEVVLAIPDAPPPLTRAEMIEHLARDLELS